MPDRTRMKGTNDAGGEERLMRSCQPDWEACQGRLDLGTGWRQQSSCPTAMLSPPESAPSISAYCKYKCTALSSGENHIILPHRKYPSKTLHRRRHFYDKECQCNYTNKKVTSLPRKHAFYIKLLINIARAKSVHTLETATHHPSLIAVIARATLIHC